MESAYPQCPVCDAEMRKSDLPKHNIWVCPGCEEIVQLQGDGTKVLINELLALGELGDDRVKAAISKPHIVNLRSFTDVYSNVQHRLMMEMAEATGAARVILSQAENRLDYAIAKMSGLDMAFDEAGDILHALREVRELIAPIPPGRKGIQKGGGYATDHGRELD